MFRVRFRYPHFKINPKFIESLRKNLQRQLRQAAKEFILEAVARIPIDTGQARGTFLPLARFLGTSVSISGNSPLPNKNPDTGGNSDKQLLFEFISYKTGEGFKVDIQLFYFWFNDFFQHNYPNGAPTPWGSIEAGWKAFLDYIKKIAPERFPKLNKLLDIQYMDYTFNG